MTFHVIIWEFVPSILLIIANEYACGYWMIVSLALDIVVTWVTKVLLESWWSQSQGLAEEQSCSLILQPFVHFASRKSFILVGWLFSLLFQGLNMTSWLPMCPLCTKVEKNFIACFEVFWTCMVIQCVPSVATSCKIFSRVVTGWILLPIKRIDTSLILYRVDVATSYWKRWWLNRVTKRWYYYHCVHDSFAFSCTLSSTVGLATTIFPFSLSLPWVDCYLTLELSFDLVVIYGHSGGYFQQGFMSE